MLKRKFCIGLNSIPRKQQKKKKRQALFRKVLILLTQTVFTQHIHMFNILQNSVKNWLIKLQEPDWVSDSKTLNHEYTLRYLSGCPVSLSTYMAVLCKQTLFKIKMEGRGEKGQTKEPIALQSYYFVRPDFWLSLQQRILYDSFFGNRSHTGIL